MNTIHYYVENYMTIFSSFSVNFPPHYHTISAINCVHASNWFTHLQPTWQSNGQNDNSVLLCLTDSVFDDKKHAIALSNVHPLYFPVRFCKRVQTVFITVKNSITIFGAEVLYRMQHRCTYLAKNPRSKSRPIALQHVSNLSTFVHLFSSAGKNIPFKNNLPVFSCFSWFLLISLDF